MPTKKSSKKRLVLLDAHAIIHRAYHALPGFSNDAGEPTGALYGLTSMLLKLTKDLQPDYVVACYDLPGKTFRHEAYDDYKAGRGEADDELVSQLQKSRDLIEAFSIPIYDAPGFEADDMLGTIVEQMKGKKNIEIIIASGDMDTLQLVNKKKVQVYTLKKGINDTILYDEDAVTERFMFGPKLLTDYKGLRGDPSDNIPGIPGIGEKTATQIITAFGSLEKVYKVLHQKNGEEKMLEAGLKKRIIGLLRDHEEDAEFSKTLAVIRRDAPITFSLPDTPWMESVEQGTVMNMMRELSFRTLANRVREYFKWGEQQSLLDSAAQSTKPSYEPSDREVAEICIALWLSNSENTNPSLDDVYDYAGTQDFKKAKEYILNELKEKKLEKVYREIELPLIDIVTAMDEKGILIDKKHFTKLSKEYHKELDKLAKSIHKYAGSEFNINSPKQLGEVLFDQMHLSTKGLKKTATGARSTRESELVKLREVHPIIDDILAYRELQKVLSTYIDNLPDMADENDRLHTKLVQSGTTTGRFSSQQPNLQNIPVRHASGKEIRNGFISQKGFDLVALDYSQIELRVAAMLSKEPHFMKAFKEGNDIHSAVAAQVFGVDEDKVDKEQRRKAKVINFGILFGMGVSALKTNLGSTRAEAQEFYNTYFETFQALSEYLESTKDFAYKNGYTETMFGRRRYFPALKSKLPFLRAGAERMAINAPIQGTEADIIRIAMHHVNELIKDEQDVRMLLQVHDELIFEIREDLVDTWAPKIKVAMETAFENSFLKTKPEVPIVVTIARGKRWGSLEEK